MIPPASPSCLWTSRDMKTAKRTPPGTPKYHRLTSEKRIIIWTLKKEGKIAVKAAKRRGGTRPRGQGFALSSTTTEIFG